MTYLMYRLDDNVTSDYAEYLEKKDSCLIAYPFYVEDNRWKGKITTEPIAERYDEIKYGIHIPVEYKALA